MAHILESSAPSAETYTVGVNGDFAGVLGSLQTLRQEGEPSSYTVVPGARADAWHLTLQNRQKTRQTPAELLATHRPVVDVRDISHAAITHTSLELNNNHRESPFLAQVVDAMGGKIVQTDGRDIRRFSADITSVEAILSFVRAFPGLARALQVNPAFEHLPLAFGEHPMNQGIGEQGDRPDFSPDTRRGVLAVNVIESLGGYLRVLDAILTSRLAVESISVRSRADHGDCREMIVVLDDTTTQQLSNLQADFAGTAYGVLSSSIKDPDSAFQFVQGVLPKGDRTVKSVLRQINPHIHTHGRTPYGHEVVSSSLPLADAAQARNVLAQAGRPSLSNGALLRGAGDHLSASQDRFALHFSHAVDDFRRSMEKFLLQQLELR
jgi:hypothetical protein